MRTSSSTSASLSLSVMSSVVSSVGSSLSEPSCCSEGEDVSLARARGDQGGRAGEGEGVASLEGVEEGLTLSMEEREELGEGADGRRD